MFGSEVETNPDNLEMALIMSDVKHGGCETKFLANFKQAGDLCMAFDDIDEP
jgi:hypothetical protein